MLRLAIAALCCGGLLFWSGAYIPLNPAPATGVASTDTIERTVEAGAVLTTTLPSTLNNSEVAAYRLVEGPAFSGVAGRSLTWPTHNTDPGMHPITVVPDVEAPPDTLVVEVTIQSNN